MRFSAVFASIALACMTIGVSAAPVPLPEADASSQPIAREALPEPEVVEARSAPQIIRKAGPAGMFVREASSLPVVARDPQCRRMFCI
ncbi:hypothetical protein BKA70DRAFT_252618 [Coprinopsis sp. MPI-PUGE-AT-0042]|nr:hypothetical protein BKA70DRAFT_252618 [Coprinopsis sp. MPI-PUGE-AT-0042]